jgi:nitric oxide reductase NorD protein
MEWDQLIFYYGNKAYRNIKNKFKKEIPYYNYKIRFEEVAILRFLLIINSESKNLITTNGRISLNPKSLYFPEEIFLFIEEEISHEFLRLVLLFLSIGLQEKLATGSVPQFSTIYHIAAKNYPGMRRSWKKFLLHLKTIKKIDSIHFKFLKNLLLNSVASVHTEMNQLPAGRDFYSDKDKKNTKTKESTQKLDLDSAELLEVEEKKIEEYTLGHNFEKIETVEEFDGQWRDIDGDEDMEEEEALHELKLRHVIRTEDPVHTTRTTESGSGTLIEMASSQTEEITALYPEWDYKKKQYKIDYCSVKEEFLREENVSLVNKIFQDKNRTLEIFKKKLQILINERRIHKRLASGSDIDLDALITRFADIAAKKTPSEFIYTNPIRDFSDITLYFLMDLSLSTDSFINGRRILDLERETLLLFSECLSHLEIPFGIGGFNSRTRNNCKFLKIKDLDESWEKSKYRMGALSPVGYTRIGPALRHANSILSKATTKHKWIILLTDARPNDYDTYEGKYGVEDVNQAVKECLKDFIKVHTLAIGTEEKPTIPAMMREASFQMLFHPEALLESLHDFFRRTLA